MCYHEVENFACGHDEKHKIPCETFCETGNCDKPEDDQVRDNAGPRCNKCKDDEDEVDFIQEELRKFAEQESLKPSEAPRLRSRDPNAPKLFFKRCIVWSRCGHHSHPRPSDIERDAEDPEYLHVEGLGNCFDCSAATPSVIAKMKQNGEYEKEDPWGAMSRPEVGEGSSHSVTLPSLEEIGQGVTHDQAKQQAREGAAASPPSSPAIDDDRSRRSASPEPEYDDSPSKGKGYPGRPTHPLSHVTTVEDNDADGEEELGHPSIKPVERSEFGEDDEDSIASDEEGELELEETGHPGLHESRKLPGQHPSMSDDEAIDQADFSGDDRTHDKEANRGRSRHGDHDNEEEDDLHDGSDTGDERGEDDLATPEELKAAGLPGNSKMTKLQVERALHRKLEAGKLAMMQFNKNEIE